MAKRTHISKKKRQEIISEHPEEKVSMLDMLFGKNRPSKHVLGRPTSPNKDRREKRRRKIAAHSRKINRRK